MSLEGNEVLSHLSRIDLFTRWPSVALWCLAGWDGILSPCRLPGIGREGEIPAGGEGPSCWKSWISDPRLPLPPRPLQSSQKKIAIAGTLKNTTTKLIAKNLFLSKYGMGQALSDKVALGEIQMKLPRISGLPTHSVPQWKHPGEILTRGSLD